jgi:hypothetical protein
MSVKLAIRIVDFAAAQHIEGAEVEVEYYIVEIENERLESLLKPSKYRTKSIGLVVED